MKTILKNIPPPRGTIWIFVGTMILIEYFIITTDIFFSCLENEYSFFLGQETALLLV